MTRNQFHTTMTGVCLSIVAMLAAVWACEFPQAEPQLGDYSKIAELNFSTTPTSILADHYVAPCCSCDGMQVAIYMQTGVDPGPLSPQYMMTTAWYDGTTGPYHGFNAFNGADIAGRVGSCPAAMCEPGTLILTPAMDEAAAKNRTAEIFLTMATIPDYPSALDYLATHPGSVVVLTTGSYRAYSIIGIDIEGKGIWLDRWKVKGQPKVLHLTEADGIARWNTMVQGQTYEPAAYMVVMNPR